MRFSIRPIHKFIFGLILAVLVVGLGFIWLGRNSQWADDELARVDHYPIFKRDVEARRKINGIMGGDPDRGDALEQLIDLYVNAAVLARHGFDLSPDAVRKEAERIDAHSQDPEALKAIKSTFGHRYDDYLRVFVLPTLARRSIYFEFFVKSEELHLESAKQAGQLLGEIMKQPERFAEIAADHQFAVGEIEVDSGDAANEWPRELALQLKPGQVSDRIVSAQEAFLIVRKSLENQMKLLTISIPKRAFDPWLASERDKLIIRRRE